MSDKRELGQYYTINNPFHHPAFFNWARGANLPEQTILEPFAGANSLIDHLSSMSLCKGFSAFDIEPGSNLVAQRDTLTHFPTGFSVCVTNPPWLAKNSATVRGMPFPECNYDNLYKFALGECLKNCEYVAALVPESFIRANVFLSRLVDFVSLTSKLFPDTDHPVGLALFDRKPSSDARIWSGSHYLGLLSEIEALKPYPKKNGAVVRFNSPEGNVGLIALDNTQGPSIRFCEVRELASYRVKPTGRHITKLRVGGGVCIDQCNEILDGFRSKTHDVLLTCYKGIRKDGKYRRRLDWVIARGIVHHAQAA